MAALAAIALAASAAADDDGVRVTARARLREQRVPATADNLQAAMMSGDVELVRLLLAAGVDPDERTDNGTGGTLELALSFHCIGGRTPAETRDAMFDALLAGGADPNVMGIGNVPLFVFVAQQCPASVVRSFAKAGARLDLRSPQGYTPLSMALVTGNLDAAEALVELGARLSPEARRKLFPTRPDDARLAALLKRASAPPPTKPR